MGRAALLFALAVCATALFLVRVQLPLLTQNVEAHSDRDTVVIASRDDDDSLLGALRSTGYRLSVDDTVELANAGVDSDLIVSVRHSGIARPSVSELIELSQSGVDEDLVVSSVRAFGRDVSVADIIALHEAGVDADYISHVCRHERLSVREIIRLHEAGVDG